MKTKQFLSLILLLSIYSCSIFKGKGELVGISIKYDKKADINYGKKFYLQVIGEYSSGKTRNISNKDGLTLKVKGADYKNQKIKIISHPTEFKSDVISANATYVYDGKSFSDSVKIPFNYKGAVELFFNGKNGTNGSDGSNGGTAWIWRFGKNGSHGEVGSDGLQGHELSIYVWKEGLLYHLMVEDLTDNKTFYYKANNSTSFYKFSSIGGKAGDGGDGGNGGDGKHGVVKDEKTKKAGYGGDAGNGANGGNGGQGGNVRVFIHPTAIAFKDFIKISNFAGTGGKAGVGGKAGKAGTPLQGNTKPEEGKAGKNGLKGLDGKLGDINSKEVTEFDFESLKN